MSDSIDEFRAKIRRRAIGFEIGGFRPPQNPMSSWFGRVGFALPGETWPTTDGKPMHALCQINLTELPFRPPRLDDLEFISVFIGPDDLPFDEPNGKNWCLRGYSSLEPLIPLSSGHTNTHIKPFPMRAYVIEEDFPCREYMPCEVPSQINDESYKQFANVFAFKLGGWPLLVQSAISWGAWNQHPIAPEYVFQIDSTEKGNWYWGDTGLGYFGRGTAPGHEDEWALEWQCY